MRLTFCDMYCALPTIQYNIKTLNCWGIVVLAAFFLSACITVAGLAWVYAAVVKVLS
jgi:hypothetical protein